MYCSFIVVKDEGVESSVLNPKGCKPSNLTGEIT